MALAARFRNDTTIRIARPMRYWMPMTQHPRSRCCARSSSVRPPGRAETAGLIGRAHARAGRIQDGVRTLRYAVRHAPAVAPRAEWQLALAEAYVALGWADDARATLDALLADLPDHAALAGPCALALAADDLATAEADLAEIAGDDPDIAELRAALAARQGDWMHALAAQRQACALAPNAERLTRLAEIGAAAGDDAARIAALEALTLHAPAPAHWAELAQAQTAAGHRTAARAAWQQALSEAAPARWWAAFGRLLQADGDTAAAQAAFGRALANDPADAASASALAEMSDLPSERVELLRQATRHAPQNVALWQMFAQSLDAVGAGEEARQALRQASGLAPADPAIAAAYAEALLAAGERLAAVEALEQACAAPDAPARLLGRLAAVLTEGLPFFGDLLRLPPAPTRRGSASRPTPPLCWRRRASADPLTPAWWIQAARLHLVVGDHSSARVLLSELTWDQLAAAERSAALALRAVALMRGGDLPAAADDARQALDGPDAVAMHAIFGRGRVRRRRLCRHAHPCAGRPRRRRR